MHKNLIFATLLTVAFAHAGTAVAAQKPDLRIVKADKGKTEYVADSKGNRILDFSQCGYRQSDSPIPDARVLVYVECQQGDQAARLQRAIDYVSTLKADPKTGLRGAILLGKGIYDISQPLKIRQSGVVIRGTSKTETVIRKTGVDRGAAIYIEGQYDLKVLDTLRITDSYVPVNTRQLTLNAAVQATNASLGEGIMIVRPSTDEWISSIGCAEFGGNLGYWGWKAGEIDVTWDRNIVAANGNAITIDVPLTVALDSQWGQPYALRYSWKGRIENSGVENLTVITDAVDPDNSSSALFKRLQQPKSEDHCWDGIYVDNARNCWVRMVNFGGLAGSAVVIQRHAEQVTVEDCISKCPVSELGGLRRRTFLTFGGKCLFQRCYSEDGLNDFSAGFCAPGPNAFVQCDAVTAHSFSGASSSWATGLLFDVVNIEGNSISFKNLGLDKWGAGWNTANSLLWQCSASGIDCYSPAADARNYAIGCWAYCQGNGYWFSTNDHVTPYSFYQMQLQERLAAGNGTAKSAAGNVNANIEKQCRVYVRDLDGSTSPTVERAAKMAEVALQPRMTMEQWINEAQLSASTDTRGAKSIDAIKASGASSARSENASRNSGEALSVASGKVLVGGNYSAGMMHRTPWWNGRTRYSFLPKTAVAVTRFVPGMEGQGLTDRMDSVIQYVEQHNLALWNQNYGLWYDRRRDDHERIKRPDGDVWAPFFEQAIARCGEGQAWDGLSKYDVTKINQWYFSRINQLAERAPQMLVINQHLFQHNILEAGAHWVDCPWRSANNINATGFLEPVPFTGDKRVFTADLFYDTTDQHRAELYRQYIWQVLDEFADKPNVYHSVSEEFTGPQHFVEFWLDCISQWNAARGQHARVILNATKDVVDAVLAQKKYADVVDIIEIEQWYYHGGNLYQPKGGLNLAPRQHLRLNKTTYPTFDDVYRTVAETHQQYADKAVLYCAKDYPKYPWAITLAGGSCPSMVIEDARLAAALAGMQPVSKQYPYDGVYQMVGEGCQLVFNSTSQPVTVPATQGGKTIYNVNRRTGALTPAKQKPSASITVPANTIWFIQ